MHAARRAFVGDAEDGTAEGLGWLEVQDDRQGDRIELAHDHVVGHGPTERHVSRGVAGIGGRNRGTGHLGHVCLELVADSGELRGEARRDISRGGRGDGEPDQAAQFVGQHECLRLASGQAGMVVEAVGVVGSGSSTGEGQYRRPRAVRHSAPVGWRVPSRDHS